MLEKAMEMTPAEFRNYPSESCRQQRCEVPEVVQLHQQQQLISSDVTAHMIITCTRGASRSAVVRTIRCFSCQSCCNDFMIALRRQAQEEHWWRRLHEEQRRWQMREQFRLFSVGGWFPFFSEPLRATPAEVMAQLPSYPFQCLSGAASVDCAVCLEALQSDDIARDLPCRHTFHRKCIDTWLSSNHTCPVCRQDLLKN